MASRSRRRLVGIGGAVVLSCLVTAAVALGSTAGNVPAVWQMVVHTQPTVDDTALGALKGPSMDPTNPWSDQAPQTVTPDANRPDAFHRWRNIDQIDPWTHRAVVRVTPPLTPPTAPSQNALR